MVDPSQELNDYKDILIESGTIAALSSNLKVDGSQVINLTGYVIVPGFVDMHVHLREPGFTEKESIFTGAAAAVTGGITSLACMPNTNPAVDNIDVVEFIRHKSREADLVRVYPIATLTKGRKGNHASDFESLYRAGVRAFSDDGSPVESDTLYYRIMNTLSFYEGAVIISHCENRELSGFGVIHEGYYSKKYKLPGIPSTAETTAVARDISFAERSGAKLHLAHISTEASVELIARAKSRDIPITAEVTPHHLLLTEDAIGRCGAFSKVNPPLRTEADRLALRQALRAGVIDIIATDHAPHQAIEKEKPIREAPFGIAGLETAVPLLLTELVNSGFLTLPDLVRAYSCHPARLLRIPGGTLRRGAPADLTVLDLNAYSLVEPHLFISKAKHSPFAGWKLKGMPILTMVGGVIKMHRKDTVL